jgi:CheY-like chemotaxis protein
MVPRERILVVDDDVEFRELYRMALRFEGFDVDVASDGWSALQTIEQQPPALLILDLNMPCVDGWAVMRELAAHEETKAIPIIVVTGAEVRQALDQAAAILRKPITPEHVLPYIHQQLRGLPGPV